jgi:malonyl-CoA O-methyltransferase
VLTLMRELKAIGAHNVTRGRARGLMGRRHFAAMTSAYEAQRRGGRLPATYEVIHAICWGAQAAARPPPGETFIDPGAIRTRGRT